MTNIIIDTNRATEIGVICPDHPTDGLLAIPGHAPGEWFVDEVFVSPKRRRKGLAM